MDRLIEIGFLIKVWKGILKQHCLPHTGWSGKMTGEAIACKDLEA